jgi:hypothetical protein
VRCSQRSKRSAPAAARSFGVTDPAIPAEDRSAILIATTRSCGRARNEALNWKSFQHYKDRAPAWIKLHRGLLDNFDFHRLPVASKALAPFLWLLASEYEDGQITASIEELAFRFRATPAELRSALKPLIDSGFFLEVVQDASAALAAPERNGVSEKRERRDREEGEGDARARDPVSRGAQDAGDALAGMRSAEECLAEMSEAWKRDIEGVNVEALQRFFDFVAREVNPPTKRKDFSPSARLTLAKRLAGMGDHAHQAAVVDQSISSDHAVLYALKDRPTKHAQESAQRRQTEQRELLGLKTRAIVVGCRAPRAGEDIGDYRVAVERAELAARDKAHRETLAKRGPKSAAELLRGQS